MHRKAVYSRGTIAMGVGASMGEVHGKVRVYRQEAGGQGYPREMSAYVHKKTCTEMLRAALFLRVKRKQKQPKSLTTGRWMNKWWLIHTRK